MNQINSLNTSIDIAPFSTAGEIFTVLPQMIGEVEAVGKTRRNTQQNYNFRSIDDIYTAVNGLLHKYQVTIVPNVTHLETERFEGSSGKNVFRILLSIKYFIFAKDGSYVTANVVGEALDTSDKGSPKALSMAYKYFIFQLLAVPIDEKLDTENEHIETKAGSAKCIAFIKEFESIDVKKLGAEKANANLQEIAQRVQSDKDLSISDKEILRRTFSTVNAAIQKAITDKK